MKNRIQQIVLFLVLSNSSAKIILTDISLNQEINNPTRAFIINVGPTVKIFDTFGFQLNLNPNIVSNLGHNQFGVSPKFDFGYLKVPFIARVGANWTFLSDRDKVGVTNLVYNRVGRIDIGLHFEFLGKRFHIDTFYRGFDSFTREENEYNMQKLSEINNEYGNGAVIKIIYGYLGIELGYGIKEVTKYNDIENYGNVSLLFNFHNYK